MRIKQTSRLITVWVVSFFAVTIACALVARQARTMQEAAYATRFEASGMADQLAAGSDRLTAAVRAYAATGAAATLMNSGENWILAPNASQPGLHSQPDVLIPWNLGASMSSFHPPFPDRE